MKTTMQAMAVAVVGMGLATWAPMSGAQSLTFEHGGWNAQGTGYEATIKWNAIHECTGRRSTRADCEIHAFPNSFEGSSVEIRRSVRERSGREIRFFDFRPGLYDLSIGFPVIPNRWAPLRSEVDPIGWTGIAVP